MFSLAASARHGFGVVPHKNTFTIYILRKQNPKRDSKINKNSPDGYARYAGSNRRGLGALANLFVDLFRSIFAYFAKSYRFPFHAFCV